jgi:hypothetical protein
MGVVPLKYYFLKKKKNLILKIKYILKFFFLKKKKRGVAEPPHRGWLATPWAMGVARPSR